MCENRFYICRHCGNLIGMIHDTGIPIECCGEEMEQLKPENGEGKAKHAPSILIQGDTVTVTIGEIAHPMEEEHSITWVYLQTDRGGQRKCLKSGTEPTVRFSLLDEKPIAAYAYCNQHGLWMTEIRQS